VVGRTTSLDVCGGAPVKAWILVAYALATGCAGPTPTASAPAPAASVAAAPASVSTPVVEPCSTSTFDPSKSRDIITRVEVRGQTRTPTSQWCSIIRTAAGTEISEERVSEDIRSLWAAELVDDVTVSSELSPSGRLVTFHVHERPLISAITIDGPTSLNPQQLRGMFSKDGSVLYPDALRDQIAALRERYLDLGYRSVDLQYRLEPAPDSRVVIRVNVKEGPQALIKAIELRGLSKLKEAELLPLIETGNGRYNAGGAVYHSAYMERDRLRITAHLYDKGMLACDVQPERLTLSEDQRQLMVVIQITEGPVYRLSQASCAGDLATTEKQCLELFGMKKGEVLNRSLMLRGIERIKEHQTKNRRGADVAPELEMDPKKQTVSVRLVVGR